VLVNEQGKKEEQEKRAKGSGTKIATCDFEKNYVYVLSN
jgi:hypothetical protein